MLIFLFIRNKFSGFFILNIIGREHSGSHMDSKKNKLSKENDIIKTFITVTLM